MSTHREELHQLADELEPAALAEVIDLARRLRSRDVRPALPNALAGVPLDDEPYTDQERADVAASVAEDPSTRISSAEARRRWG